MKKLRETNQINETYAENLPSARLFFNDLEAIYEIISTTSEKTRIFTEDGQFDNMDDLREKGADYNRIFTLKIIGYVPSITLVIDKDRSTLSIRENNVTSREAFEKIKEIIKKRKRPFGSLGTRTVLLVLSLLLPPLSAAGMLFLNWSTDGTIIPQQQPVPMLLLQVVCIPWGFFGLMVGLVFDRSTTIVHRTYKKD